MDVFTAIDERASAVRLGGPGPDPAALERILTAAIRAPDHGRLAPWRFIVLEGAARGVLGDAMAALLQRRHPGADAAMLATERAKTDRAPVIVVVAAHVDPAHKVPEIEQLLAVAAAVENMLLAAQALGIGTMWKTGNAAYDPQVKTALGLGTADHIVAFLYLGTSLAAGKPRPLTLEGVVRHL